MNPCARNRKQIAWLAAGALEGREANELRAHLETCADCRQYFEEMSRVTTTLAAAQTTPDIQTSEAFHRRVARALRVEESRPASGALAAFVQRTLWNWRIALPVASASIVVIVGVFLSLRHPDTAPRPRSPAEVASVPQPKTDVPPTLANYQIMANRSFDEFDDLLTRQANRSQPHAPIYTASTSAFGNAPE